jgi:alkylation response protein AidB-like acyl-CoA dehydrogenase
MDFRLSDDQRGLQDVTRRLARAEFLPQAPRWDREENAYPAEAVALLAEQGYLGMSVPEEYGGLGYDAVSYVVVIEELAYASAALAILVAVHNTVGAWPIVRFGSEEQKRRLLPRLAEGEIGCFSLSEPDAGSDVASLTATARREGDTYVLNGSKNWVTNGAHATIFNVFAKTDPQAGPHGITGFVVEAGTPGLEIGKHEDKMGLRSSDTVSLSLTDLHVPVSARLGDEGMGMKIALAALDAGRIGVAAQAVGVAQAALDQAVAYARVRRAFGKLLSDHGPVQTMLAEMERRIVSARLLMYRAAWLRDQGRPYTEAAALAKLYATESATYVTHRAIQVHGGYGYVKEYPVERLYRDARVFEIYEGTSEIQRLVIAREMLKRAESALDPARETVASAENAGKRLV